VKISLTDCNCKELINLCEKCGFIVFHGRQHEKIKDKNGKFITTIPRHSKIKRETARGIIKQLKNSGCDIEW